LGLRGHLEGIDQDRGYVLEIGGAHRCVGGHVVAGAFREDGGFLPLHEVGDRAGDDAGLATVLVDVDSDPGAGEAYPASDDQTVAVSGDGIEHGGHVDQWVHAARRHLAVDLRGGGEVHGHLGIVSTRGEDQGRDERDRDAHHRSWVINGTPSYKSLAATRERAGVDRTATGLPPVARSCEEGKPCPKPTT
jgi:hypothetical protein